MGEVEGKNRASDGPLRGNGRQEEDPYGLYRRWFDLLGEERGDAGPVDAAEFGEMWRRWFETAAGSGAGGLPKGMAKLWREMAQDASAEMLSGDGGPREDPLRFFLRWYEATHERWSEAADDMLKDEEFLESSSSSLEAHARAYREQRRLGEAALQSLGAPTGEDVARVARLVVALEDKVDRVEAALAKTGERIVRLEEKMDRLLAALEGDGAHEPPEPRGGYE